MQRKLIEEDMDRQIAATHKRFQQAMEKRLKEMPLESKERYFAVLSALVARLENPHLSLREILKDTLIEAAPYIAQEMGEPS